MIDQQMINDFSIILDEHGVWVVRVHPDRNFACSRCTVDQLDSSCPICFGTGHPVTLTRAKIVITKQSPQRSQDTTTTAGLLVESDRAVYVPADTDIEELDYLIEVVWSVPIKLAGNLGEPKKLIHVYLVDLVEPQYFGGSLTYWVVRADDRDILNTSFSEAIRRRAEGR